MPDVSTFFQVMGVFVAAVIGAYAAVRGAIKAGGKIIPGDDPLERADRVLTKDVDPWIARISSGISELKDLLRSDTNGGVGHGPDNPG